MGMPEETTMMPEPETTMMTEPETTMMTEMETTMAPTKSPSYTPQIFMSMPSLDGTVCTNDDDRSFKRTFETAEACADFCDADSDCMYFSWNSLNSQCIGCDVEPSVSNSHTPNYAAYMMMG